MNPEDKPITMPLRDWLIKRIALSKNIPSSIVESIISHQFDSANAATYVHKSLEISGFGRFVFSDIKANNQMKRYYETEQHLHRHLTEATSDEEREIVQEKLSAVIKNAIELKKRMNL